MDGGDNNNAPLAGRVRQAVIWRSGSQILSQIIGWSATLIVVRLLDPTDYGLFAMSTVVMAFLNFLNGYGFASSLVHSEEVTERQKSQAFGMMILLNIALSIGQILAAPAVAAYYGHPIIKDMLIWQSLIYLSTPLIVMSEALMVRDLNFKKPAIVNIAAAIAGAGSSLVLALMDQGVWTLVFAPVIGFWVRAILLVAITKMRVLPIFNFSGAGKMLKFGGAIMISQGFWIVQSQADIIVAGRALSPHDLGIYTQAMFITTIFASKFIPPLNEVAFPAYSRMQHDAHLFKNSWLKTVRMIMVVTLPLYFGLAVTADPFIKIILGDKWHETIPMVRLIAFAMPFMTLQILFHPAINAAGRPNVTARNSIAGAIIMPCAFLFGVHYGGIGLSIGWLIAFPLLLAFTYYQARNIIGVSIMDVIGALWPAIWMSSIMACIVYLSDHLFFGEAAHIYQSIRLSMLVAIGGVCFLGLLRFMARPLFDEVVMLIRKPAEAVKAD
ncbi:hypothetical protein LPB140_10765 [Sphingorhabdus lutea]|uniref:Uncharacterized protein n=1 Tax=Sphingorhabdus lutea TaxID=1913578 RepID=A0A1L3JF78_9SPHN|nr:hypothetical protein LPB140_10765 [Sphingorhabdus lutea]